MNLYNDKSGCEVITSKMTHLNAATGSNMMMQPRVTV